MGVWVAEMAAAIRTSCLLLLVIFALAKTGGGGRGDGELVSFGTKFEATGQDIGHVQDVASKYPGTFWSKCPCPQIFSGQARTYFLKCILNKKNRKNKLNIIFGFYTARYKRNTINRIC